MLSAQSLLFYHQYRSPGDDVAAFHTSMDDGFRYYTDSDAVNVVYVSQSHKVAWEDARPASYYESFSPSLINIPKLVLYLEPFIGRHVSERNDI